MSKYEITDKDLRSILRAGFTPDGVEANAAAYAECGLSLGEVTRVCLQLANAGSADSSTCGETGPTRPPRAAKARVRVS